MELLFNTFPREFGLKRIIAKDRNEFIKLINTYNGIMNCYSNVYKITDDRKYGDTIDKLFFDLDNPKTCWEATKRMHKVLCEQDIRHVVLLSGGGYHIYVFSKICSLMNKKNAIANAQHEIAKMCGVTIGEPKITDVDRHVIGDVARIARIPNTWNVSRRRFCVYLSDIDFDKTDEEIKLEAKQQRTKRQIFGTKLFDIKAFDCEPTMNSLEYMVMEGEMIEIKEDNHLIGVLPPFVRVMVLTHQDGHRDRFLTILACREAGIPLHICKSLCKKYWSQEKFYHALTGHGLDQFDYIYRREGQIFPNWETLVREGYKITKDDIEFSFYRK